MNQAESIEQMTATTPHPKSSSLMCNAAWMAWSGTISIANSVVLWVALARWREAPELGRFTVVMSAYLIFVILCSLGLGPYLASEVALRKDRYPLIASASALLLTWAAICTALMSVSGFFISQSHEVWLATALLSLAMLPTGLITVAEAVFTACGRAHVIAQATTLENLLRTIVPLALLYRGYGLPLICLSFVGVRLAACAFYAIVARRHLAALRLVEWTVVRELAAKVPTFAGMIILTALHGQVAAILVNRLGGETAAAEFGAASRFLLPLAVLLPSYASVMQPEAARLAAISLTRLGEFLSRSMGVVIALTLPFAVGATLVAQSLLTTVFGARYAGAAVALSLYTLSLVPFGLVMIVSRGLIATGTQHIDLIGNAAAVATNLIVNLLLIPRYGAAGAAAAQLCSMSVLAAIEIGYATRRLFHLSMWRAVMICTWPLGLMTLAVWQARQLGLWGAVATGGIVYLGCMWFKRHELKFGV